MSELIIALMVLVSISICALIVSAYNRYEDIRITREINHDKNLKMFPRQKLEGVAQSVEHLTFNQGVGSSSLLTLTHIDKN